MASQKIRSAEIIDISELPDDDSAAEEIAVVERMASDALQDLPMTLGPTTLAMVKSIEEN